MILSDIARSLVAFLGRLEWCLRKGNLLTYPDGMP